MHAHTKVSCAIAAILGGGAMNQGMAADATAADASGLGEIIVTAQRRSENIQNVPIAIQAFTAETLAQLNVETFDDLIKYLPNVTASSAGPGQSQIYMRGLSVGDQGSQSGGSISGFPNVAIYLDDQSGQLPGRNLDVYAADLERVEVLEGPQGTLFGAGAQAGVIRYITNKPKLDVTEGNVSADYGTTAGGDPNGAVTAVLNLPLISDALAVRAVIYDDHHGGYINNVPSTFTRQNSDLGIHYANYPTGCSSCQVPPGSPVINNASTVGNAINPVTYQGLRVSALGKINEDWNVLLTQSYQSITADGVFYQMPNGSDGQTLPAQSVTLFNPSYNDDKFENTAWTVNGKVSDLKLVYTGAYLVRNVQQQQDYTNYARGLYADYYQCHGAEPANGLAATCYSPSATWNETERNTHQSHEFRVSTPDDWRVRDILGAYWEELEIDDQLNWLYKTMPACTATVTVGCLTNVATVPGSSVNNPGTRNDNTAFFNDVQRGYRQTAFFTSLDVDLIPKVLTLTGGTRYFRFVNDENGTVAGSFGCYEAGPGPCFASAKNINLENEHTTYTGFKSRANLTWHVSSDVLVYYTWSQGFRPGAFNRTTGCYIPDGSNIAQYCSPTSYASDSLTNNEIGWKSEFLDHRIQWNGAVYQENWNNVQVDFFDPGVLGNVGFDVNGPDYRIRGVETSFIAAIADGLTAQGAASWNSSTQTNSPYLIANNPLLLSGGMTSAAEYGKPILSVTNPYGPIGGPSANSPPLQFNLRLRYQWTMNNYNAFAQAGATHTAHSYTQSSANPAESQGSNISTTLLRFENPAYTQYDASLGIGKDAWSTEVYAQNLTNENVSTYTSTNQFVVAQTILRPRVIGVKFRYKF